MNSPKWKQFQDYIANELKELDPYARSTKGSGNQNEKSDVKNNTGLQIECKLRNTESVKIDKKIWEKLCSEIPLHVSKIPMLALENKTGQRWAVLDLDEFLQIWKHYYILEHGENK